ncbi:MAG: AAA family ATPase [Planctomycetes bacterium]|nr:AAA family ATPase [Planctomycetota bacterium]
MTISLEQLCEKLAPRFPDIEQVDESVARFERKAAGRPFAVCYVDVSAHIPDSAAALSSYQDRVVARHYFNSNKSLQWSNYLFFLVDTLPPPAARAIVERDRKYARKFVLTEPELQTALSPPSFQVSDAIVRTDVLATWTGILAAANLDKAILNDESLPKRLDLIEASFGQAALSVPTASSSPQQSKQPFLKQVELNAFREHPLTKKFDLGLVTLICGANGTGKTSLMEAIELVYCGRTKRNPEASDTYSITAKYTNGKSETANYRRAQSLFRDRHLAWYGQSETRTNNLFQTFARFNFLNTDAAVGLAEAKDNFDEDLSKLLVGPDASKTWREIGRTADKLDEKIKELEAIKNQVDLDLASYSRQIAASGELKQESSAVLKKLDEMLAQTAWARDEGDAASSVKELVESLSEFETLTKQAIGHDWVGAPVSMAKMRLFVKQAPPQLMVLDQIIKEVSDARAFDRGLQQDVKRLESTLTELKDLLKIIEAGLPERLSEIERITPQIAKLEQITLGYDERQMLPHLREAATLTVVAYASTSANETSNAAEKLDDARNRYASFNALRDESVSLGQRLREIAGQILNAAPEPDQCPLCHTQFGPGELASHIHMGVDAKLEEKAASLLTSIREMEAIVAEAVAKQSAAQWAVVACQRLERSLDITVSELVRVISESQREYADLIALKSRLTAELSQLQKSDVTIARYRQLVASVAATIGDISNERVKAAIGRIESEITVKLTERDRHSKAIQSALATAETILPIGEGLTLESAVAQLKERLITDESLLGRLAPYAARLSWPEEQSFSQLAVTIGSIRQLAGDYQVTLSREKSAVKVLAEASTRRDQLQRQLAGLLPRIERFSEARQVLSTILNEHSLNSAMEEALRQNRVAIETIFARIHSPAEFSGLGESMTTLVRKNGGSLANLSQISTGQRAAFALSLFLAQNAQLRTAPPVILIDDPIAHVDDLNCLSFLDYLREVVVAGDRQVVFATANDKLAVLFERKFDFLGKEDFRRYDLAR